MTTAVVLGASGSVGKAVIDELARNGFTIVAIVRRPTGDERIREIVIPDMDPAKVEAAARIDGVGLSTLGVGAGTAKLTLEEHRAIDVALNEAFARGLAAAGSKHLALMTAVGADPTAKSTGSGAAGMARYARVKGEAEEAVKAHGPPVVSIFRPAMIIGSQHTPWLMEKILPVFGFLTPKKYKSISVEQIARAMVATSLHPPAATAVYHYPEMLSVASPRSPQTD